MKRSAVVLFLTVMLAAAGAAADDVRHGVLTISDAWSRATPARNGVVYLTVFNNGAEIDRLTGAESPVAARAELHAHSMKDDIMRMQRIDGIELDPGEPAVLAPGGTHIMLLGLKAPLKDGQSFPLTLVFEKGGRVTLDVAVGKAGAMAPGGGQGGASHGGHRHGS